MLFNSWVFAIFLPTVFAAYWGLQRVGIRAQNVMLLVASYVFYGYWDARFLVLIFVSSAIDYVVGLKLSQGANRRGWLSLSIVANLGILGFFKYFDFFKDSFAALAGAIGINITGETLHILLPVGISFYTFQSLSYSIDVYRGDTVPTRDPVAFFAYVAFFPQLVAGPIERARRLLPQFNQPRSFAVPAAKDGLRQILWGFFKKLVVADNIAPHVDAVFAAGSDLSSPTLWLGTVLFAFQIYCDFSGYSDIAIGVARLFGFRLMQNFSYPYFSRNIAEFWRRWHISLSTWFRDYVYVPLGGNRLGPARHVANVLVTFTISGLWHGANWTFVVWGFLNGLYYLPVMWLHRHKRHARVVGAAKVLPSLPELLSILVTFLFTTIAWVFFRAPSLGAALVQLKKMVVTPLAGGTTLPGALTIILATYVAVLVVVEWMQRERPHGLDVAHLPISLRWSAYLATSLAIAFLGNFGELQFIYFQF